MESGNIELRCGYKLYPADGRIDLCQIESRVGLR
jgi:hypothetical protein